MEDCPKCKSDNVHLVDENPAPETGDYWPSIWCKNCGWTINGQYWTKQELLNAWGVS